MVVAAIIDLAIDASDGEFRGWGIPPPAPQRKRITTWAEFIRAHLSVLAATGFSAVKVLTLRGLVAHSRSGSEELVAQLTLDTSRIRNDI